MDAPKDQWLICGHPTNSIRKNRGCTCTVYDPTPLLVQQAIRRLAAERPPEEMRGGRHAGSPPHA